MSVVKSKRLTSMLVAMLTSSGIVVAQETLKSGTLNLVPASDLLLLANDDSDSVSLVSVAGQPQLLAELPVGKSPQNVVADQQGKMAFVSNRFDNTVSFIDIDTQSILGCLNVNPEPFGLVAGRNHLFIASEAGNTVEIVDLNSYRTVKRINTPAAPRGLALSADESTLYVSHFRSGELSVINTESRELETTITVSTDANLSQTITLDETSNRAYLPQTFSNSSNQALLFDTTVFPAVTVIDLDSRSHDRRSRISLDFADRPVSIPIDSVLDSQQRLLALNAGSNDISVINTLTGRGVAHLQTGANPRGIRLSKDQGRAFVSNSLDGTLQTIDLATLETESFTIVTDIPLSDSLLNGKQLFNSADREDLSRDQWIACATCHFDGEHDGRTWFFADGPRNTTSLLGIADTLPLHWSGDLDEIHDVEISVRDLQAGTGLVEGDANCDPACDEAAPNAGRSQDLDDLAAYIQSLEIGPSPKPANQEIPTESALRGREIFYLAETGCATCHKGPAFTDQLIHNVGTGTAPSEKKGPFFDTPTLRGLLKTAPYLHDGSADSLRAVLTTSNSEDLHGFTSQLSEGELDDLVSFLESLPIDSSQLPDTSNNCSLTMPDQSASLELELNRASFSPAQQFQLQAAIEGDGTADLYVAIVMPGGDFVTLSAEGSISPPNQLIPYWVSREVSRENPLSILDITLPQDLVMGTYQAISLLTRSGVDPLDPEYWLGSSSLKFYVTSE